MIQNGPAGHVSCILNSYDRAAEEIRQLRGSGKSPLRIAAGDLWGYVLLPEIIRDVAARHPHVLIDIVGRAARLEGLRNGTYDLAFGIIDESAKALYRLTFLKLQRFGFTVYGDEHHPLRRRDRVSKADLARYKWVNHRFEFGLRDGSGGADERDYAIKANTLFNTIRMIRGSELLISVSSGFESLFNAYGIFAICTDDAGLVSDSGAIYWGDLQEKPIPRSFIELVKSRV